MLKSKHLFYFVIVIAALVYLSLAVDKIHEQNNNLLTESQINLEIKLLHHKVVSLMNINNLQRELNQNLLKRNAQLAAAIRDLKKEQARIVRDLDKIEQIFNKEISKNDRIALGM